MRKLINLDEVLGRAPILCATVVAAGLLVSMGVESRAGSWCAEYYDGGIGCGFESQGQCLEDVRGIGGLCIRNPYRDELHLHRPVR